MDLERFKGGAIGTTISAIGASLSLTELQAIVSIIATVVGLIITITTTIIWPLMRKRKAEKRKGIGPDGRAGEGDRNA